MKKRLFLCLIIIIIPIMAFTMTGCSISLPGDPATLISKADAEWKSANKKTVTDTFSLKKIEMSVPVEIPIINVTKNINFVISNGILTIKRKITDDKITINVTLEKLSLALDKVVDGFVPKDFHYDKLPNVVFNIAIEVLPAKMTFTTTITNLNQVSSEFLPSITNSAEFSDAQYKEMYPNYKTYATQSIFGVVYDNGVIDAKEHSYSYDIPPENVNDELFRLIKVLIDTNGDKIIGDNDNTIRDVMQEIFGSKDIIKILNGMLTPQKLKVTSYLAKGKKAYYFKEFGANYIASGKINEDASKKLVAKLMTLLKIDTGAIKINVSGDININLTMSLLSELKILGY